MTNHRELALDILARLGAQPATSFLEAGVAGVVREVSRRSRRDPITYRRLRQHHRPPGRDGNGRLRTAQ